MYSTHYKLNTTDYIICANTVQTIYLPLFVLNITMNSFSFYFILHLSQNTKIVVLLYKRRYVFTVLKLKPILEM